MKSMTKTISTIVFATAVAKTIVLIVFVIDFILVSPFRNIGSGARRD